MVAEKPAKKRALRKAIMYATIGFKGSVLEKFQAVKAAGFEGVEPMSHMNQDEVLKAFDATGLKPASVCCDTHWGKPLSHADEKGASARAWKGCSAPCRTPSATAPPRCCWSRRRQQGCPLRCVLPALRCGDQKAVPVAKELGVKIAIENVWNNFITKPEQAIAFPRRHRQPTRRLALRHRQRDSLRSARGLDFPCWASASSSCTSRNTAG